MKLLHTADWHAGRSLKGADRTPEVRDALLEIAEVAKTEAVDAVLVAGDVFDKRTPPANAEAAVYDFFLSLAERDIPSIVIAGNHDSPSRLDALSGLLSRVGARVFGEVKVAREGGAFSLNLAGDTLHVAALPFISERRLVRMADLIDADPGQWRRRYQEGMKALVGNLSQHFAPDAVNILMMHTTMEGATLAHSEYQFYCTEDYTVMTDIIPDMCNYVALGHIHKPQPIKDYAGQGGRYSGSLLQLDFGEAGDTKSVFIIDAKPGRPTELVKQYDITSGKNLRQFRVTYDELDRRMNEIESFAGYAKLIVNMERPLPGLKDRLRRNAPNVLDVVVVLPERPQEEITGVDFQQVSMIDAFSQYYQEQRGTPLDNEMRQAFNELYEDVSVT